MMLEIVRTHKDVITEIPLNDTSSAIAASATKMKQVATSSTIDWSLEDTTETDCWDETSSSFDEVAPPVRATEETTMPSCSSLHHHTLTHKRDIIPEESSFHSDTKNTDSEDDDDDSTNHADTTPVEDDEVSIDFGSIQYYYTTPRSTHQSLSGSESSFSFVGSAASRSRANSMDTTDSSVGWVHEEEQNLNDSIHLRLAKLQLLPENLSSQVS